MFSVIRIVVTEDTALQIFAQMLDLRIHATPKGFGVLQDRASTLISQRRWSIICFHAPAYQMTSIPRYVNVCEGEIYSHADPRPNRGTFQCAS